jgi:hypothetical protein
MNLESTDQKKTQTDLLGDFIKTEKIVLSNSTKLSLAILIILFMLLNLFLAYKALSIHPKNLSPGGSNKQADMLGPTCQFLWLFRPVHSFCHLR